MGIFRHTFRVCKLFRVSGSESNMLVLVLTCAPTYGAMVKGQGHSVNEL